MIFPIISEFSQVIVSIIEDTVRSTGSLLDSGVAQYPSSQIVTHIIDTDTYSKYNQLLLANTGLFEQHGAVGMDALFVPYTTYYEHSGVMPKFTRPTDTSNVSVDDLNPFNPQYRFGRQVYNNGVAESGTTSGGVYEYSGIHGTGNFNILGFAESGHNISIAATANIFTSDGTLESGIHPISAHFDSDFEGRKRVEILDVKSIAHRGPLILSGPGYDIEGQPVPGDGSGNFHKEAFWNTSLWPTGPVDLRWDNSRGVWTGGNTTKIYLSKVTNLYTPPSFSFEVDRSTSRDQFTRNAPAIMQSYADYGGSAELGVLLDPEYVAFNDNNQNAVGNTYEQLDYTNLEFPFYEAFIIRETKDPVGQTYYNIWTEDCQDCGHVANPCASGSFPMHGSSGNLIVNKKILIENPLRQALDVGDLAFTVDTGRKKKVNTGTFIGGSGVLASGQIVTNSSGIATFSVLNAGSGYTTGGFGIVTSGLCLNLALTFSGSNPYGLTSGTVTPSGNFPPNKTFPVKIYPANAIANTETLPIHWIMQAEFKSQQVITHVECEHGMLQTCSMKIQTQGLKTCEWCGEDSALINSF